MFLKQIQSLQEPFKEKKYLVNTVSINNGEELTTSKREIASMVTDLANIPEKWKVDDVIQVPELILRNEGTRGLYSDYKAD